MDRHTLQAINAIESLKARYFRGFDTKDWPVVDSALADDVVVDTTALDGDQVTGASAYLAMLKRKHSKTTTVHHGHMPEIRLTSSSKATGTWAVHVLVIGSDGRRELCFGHDQDNYALRDGKWLITSTTSTRLYEDQS
jgi:hypothetical protein